jgi:preprotein translocase subunit SecA
MQKKLIAQEILKRRIPIVESVSRFTKKQSIIKFLSEEGIKQLLQKTENQYMQDNKRHAQD